MSVVLRRTVWGDFESLTDVLTTCAEVIFGVNLTLTMTSAQVVKTSVKLTPNSPSQDYTHPDNHNLRTYESIICQIIFKLVQKDYYGQMYIKGFGRIRKDKCCVRIDQKRKKFRRTNQIEAIWKCIGYGKKYPMCVSNRLVNL